MNVLDKRSLCCANIFYPEGAGSTWTDGLRTSRIYFVILPLAFFFEYKDYTSPIARQGLSSYHRLHNVLIMHQSLLMFGIVIGTILITQYADGLVRSSSTS
eukprot:15345124-Heterocapsa_arctica.AAC.1